MHLMPTITIEIKGLAEILRRADGRHLLAGPLRKAFDKTGYAVSRRAKELAPVDRGNLRAGIGHIVDFSAPPAWVEIGTRNLPYAKAIHEGRPPGIWPPPGPLKAWIRRKKIVGEDGKPLPVFVIQRSIYLHGTKARPFLQDALDQTEGKIQGFFDRAAAEIEAKWQT